MNKNLKEYFAVIVAGGSGKRFGDEIPKQFLLLKDKPVLMHTISLFAYPEIKEIIVVLPENNIPVWNNLIKQYSFSIPHRIISGGSTRFQSVLNGLNYVPDNSIAGIHDGVRPLCTLPFIKRCFEEAEKTGNAIPAISLSESVREISGNDSKIKDRNSLRLIQTPQCFDSTLLKKAYQKPEKDFYTDDASVFEADGNKINLIEGERMNLKITFPEDLAMADRLWVSGTKG